MQDSRIGVFVIRVLVPTTVEQGDLAEVLRLYDELVTETRKEDGCINYELLQRTENPCELVLVEEWESQEHLDAHTHTEHFVRLVEALDKLETAAPGADLHEGSVAAESSFSARSGVEQTFRRAQSVT